MRLVGIAKTENGTEGRRPEGLKANVVETPQATNEMQEADLENAEKALFEGMQDKMQDTRESEYMEADKSVDAVAHEDGNVYRTTLPETGETIFITGGKVVLDSEGYIDVNQSEGLVALMPNGKKEAIQPGNIREKVAVENAEAQKAAKRAEIDNRYKQQLNTFIYTDKADGAQHTVQLVSRGADMARVVLDGVEQDIPNNVFDEIVAEATRGEVENGEIETESEVEPVGKTEQLSNGLSNGLSNETVQPQTALERVPKAENGEPVYEQADAETAWDAIMEQTNDEELATQVVEGMIADKEAALKKLENSKVREGVTVAEKIAAAQQRKAAIEKAKADLAKWQEIAGVKAKRAETAAVETAPVVESAPVEEVETPQATNEMQEADLTEDVKTEDVNESTISQISDQVGEQVVEGGNAPGQSGVPVNEEVGPFGRIYRQFKGKAKEAIQFLLGMKEGEAVGALSHPEIGDIDLVWGEEGTSNSDGYGLAKLAKYHPEVLDNLQEIINDMRVTKRSANRVQLESDTHQAAVRLTWDNKSKNWLLTAFEKKNSVSDNTTDTGETSDGGKQNDTATLQNTVSTDEGTTQSAKVQEKAQKSEDVKEVSEETAQAEDEVAAFDKQAEIAKEREQRAGVAPRPGHLAVAIGEGNEKAVEEWKAKFDSYLQKLNADDLPTIDATIKSMQGRKKDIRKMNKDGYKDNSNYKAYDYIETVLKKRAAELKKKQQARLADHAKGVAEKLGVEVTVHNDESTVTNKEAMQAITEGGEVKGWYNPNTGEIALFMPNMESMRDVESTILHEAVSHYGIKHFLGKEDFYKFLDGVWEMMPAGARAFYLDYVGADMKNPSKAKMRQAADEYVAHIAEKMDLNELEKSVWQRFIDYVMDVLRKAGFKNLKQRDIEAVIRASYANLRQNGGNSQVTGQGETMARMKLSDNRGVNSSNNLLIDDFGENLSEEGIRFSIRTDKEVVANREKQLARSIRNGLLSKSEADDIREASKAMLEIAQVIADAKNGDGTAMFPSFSQWNGMEVMMNANGRPVVSVIKANSEYPMNIDFAKDCIKRDATNRVLNRLAQVAPQMFTSLTSEQLAAINDIIKKHGLSVPCVGCFVEAKRYRSPEYARSVVNVWNTLVDAVEKGDEAIAETKKELGDKVSLNKIVEHLKKNPSDRIKLSESDIVSPKNYSALMIEHPAVPQLLQNTQGQNVAQLVVPEAVYYGDVLKLTGENAWDVDAAYQVGGVRIQSFSDFKSKLFFDYCQVLADLASKRLPAHSYTKVPAFAELFGLTGMKINLSLYFEGTGLDSEGNYTYSSESISPEFAYDLQSREGYTENVGTMAIGVSDEHIWKMMKDENIRSISPYHKSGINPVVANRLKASQFTDYTNEQNAVIPKTERLENESWQDYYGRITERVDGKVPSVGKKVVPDFNLYDDLLETNDPVQTAKNYVEHCQANGIVPKFASFVYNPDGSFNNEYYKLLYDFAVTDMNGEYAPQGAVTWNGASMPANTAEILQSSLSTEEATIAKNQAQTDAVVDDILRELGEEKEDIRFRKARIRKDSMREHAAEWADGMQKQEPKQWAKIVEAMKLSPVWNMVEGDDNSRAAEVLQRLSDSRVNDLAQKEIDKARGVIEKAEAVSRWYRIKNAISDFWNWVQRNIFNTEPKNWEDFVDEVVGDFEGMTKAQRLKQRVGALTRDILNAVFEKAGIDINLAEPVNVEQVAVSLSSVGEPTAPLGQRSSAESGELQGEKQTVESGEVQGESVQARNRNMDREAWKKAFKKGGEKAYDLMYELHGGIVSTYPQEFLAYLKEVIGVADDVANIIEGAHDYLIADFKKKNPDLFKKNETEKVEDVHSLLATKGYSLLEHTMDNGKAIGMKMMYRDKFVPSGKTDAGYTPGTKWHGMTVICYYNHPEARLQNQYVFTVTKDNAMETPTAYELVADPSLMTPEWAEYLEKIGRKDADGTFFLDGLVPNFNDPFSLSHLMIRVNKNSYDVETISRYNHGAFNERGEYERIAGQPNATLGNDLDKLVDGLSESLMEYKQLVFLGAVPLGENMVVANDGKIYRYNDIKGGVHLGNGFWIDRRGDVHVINPGKEKLVGEFLYGGGKVKNVTNGESVDIHGLKFTENGVEFYTGGEEVTETREIEIKGEKKTVTKKVIKGDAKNVITFNGDAYLETESADAETIGRVGKLYDVYSIKGDNLTEAGNGFLEDFFWVRRIDFPNLEKVGDNCFNATLTGAYLPKLREVGDNCFNRVRGVDVPSLPSLEKVGANFLYSVGTMGEDVNIDFPKLREVGNFFMKNAQPSVVSLPSLETVGEGFIKGSMRGVTVDLPNLTKAGYEFFGGGFSVQSLNAPKLTDVKNDFMEGNQEIRQQIMEQVEAKEETRFRKMNEHAEEFNKTHKGGLPVVEINPNNMEAELAEEGFTTEEIDELKKRMKKGAGAFYNPDRNLIYLLDPTLDKERVYSYCWHEDTHVASVSLGVAQELKDEFYSLAQGKKKENLDAFLKALGYEKKDYPEESMAHSVQAMAMLDKWEAGILSKLTGSTAEGAKRQMEIIQPLIDYINNGRQGNQSNLREDVRNGDVYDTASNEASRRAKEEGTGETATGGLTEEEINLLTSATGYSREDIVRIFGNGETRFRKAVQDSEEARQEIESLDNEVLATIEELAQELYSNVGVIADIESIPDEKKRRDAKRGMKGWYDPATGMVSVVLPNIADKQDAVETMLHEIVGHRGLRGLLGEKYNEFLNEVFVNAPKEMRADIMKIVMAQKADGSRTPLRTAVEEYLAGIAEGGFVNNPTLWTKIMTALKQLLRSMGVKVDVSENELAYMLWRSYQLLKGGYNIEQRIIDSVMQQRMEVGEYRRRNTAFHGPMRSQGRNLAKEIELFGLRDEYEKMILSTGFQSREAFQDSMLALKKFQEMLEKATGKKLPDYFNAYYMENALSSANQAQAEAYGRLFYKKIVDEINKLKKTFKQEDIFDYLIIKHGIERNREMAVRSVLSSEENGLDRKMYKKYVEKKKEILKKAEENKLSWEETQRELDELAERFGADLSKDYSGLSAIFSEVKGKEKTER